MLCVVDLAGSSGAAEHSERTKVGNRMEIINNLNFRLYSLGLIILSYSGQNLRMVS